mmetsp:Transcript_23683/g.66517  ORF Transcript_23683/g.66517 Transcript_23683/m.66517 type:complete len:279 (-) Transcript_23683:2343-3179(-)
MKRAWRAWPGPPSSAPGCPCRCSGFGCAAAAAASAGAENAQPRGCGASMDAVGAPREVVTCLRAHTIPCAVLQRLANSGLEKALLPPDICGRTPGATPRSLRAIAFATRRRGCLRRPRDAPLLRARYWLHRGTHCSWQALSGTPHSDSRIGRPCHAAEDELGPARLATLLGILSALGRRSKNHCAQQRAATRSAPAPSLKPNTCDHGPLRDRRLRHGALRRGGAEVPRKRREDDLRAGGSNPGSRRGRRRRGRVEKGLPKTVAPPPPGQESQRPYRHS